MAWAVSFAAIFIFTQVTDYRFPIVYWEFIQTAYLACFYLWIRKNNALLSLILGKVLFIDIGLLVFGYPLGLFESSTIITYSVVSFSGWWTFCVTFITWKNNNEKTYEIPADLNILPVKITTVFFICISLGTALMLSLIYTGSFFGFLMSAYGSREGQVNTHFLYPLQYFALGCVPLIAIVLKKDCFKILWYSILIAVVLYFILKGSRGWVLVSVVSFLMVSGRTYLNHILLTKMASNSRKSRYKFSAYVIFFILIASLVIMTTTRSTGVRLPAASGASGVMIRMLVEGKAGLDGAEVGLEIIDSLNRNELTYLYGKSYFAAFVNPIPRAIWSNKPVAFSSEVMPIIDPYGHANRSPTIFVEAFANFGWLGPPFVAVCFGLFVAVIGLSREWYIRLIAIHIIPFLFLQVRGDFLSITVPMLMSFIPILIAAIILKSHRLTVK